MASSIVPVELSNSACEIEFSTRHVPNERTGKMERERKRERER